MLIQAAILLWIACVLVQGTLLTPLVHAPGIRRITALIVFIAAASLTTLITQLIGGTLTSTAAFSLPALYSGVLLALSFLLLIPSLQLLGLSGLLLTSLLSSLVSICLCYIYALVPVLGYEYDAGSAMHFSAFVLSTLVGCCGIGCFLVAVANRLTAEEEAARSRDKHSVVHSQLEASSDNAYVDIDSLAVAGDETPNEQYSLNEQLMSPLPASSSTLIPSTLCCPLTITSHLCILRAALLSSQHKSRASVRVSVGIVTCLLSALLYSVHLIPIYATQRLGILHTISLEPYLLSIHLGLLLTTLTLGPLTMRAIRTLSHKRPQQQSVLLSARLTAACCMCGALAGLLYWWVLAYMPSHAHIVSGALKPEYEWYYYSSYSDGLTVIAYSVPRVVLTALAWAIAKEHRLPILSTKSVELVESEDETRAMILVGEAGDVDNGRVQERAEETKVVRTKVSWSTVSLWCLALVLGALSDGVAAYAWDEGY